MSTSEDKPRDASLVWQCNLVSDVWLRAKKTEIRDALLVLWLRRNLFTLLPLQQNK